ncbi:MAG: bifunctional riboflavin kinase/FAD synthetase [Clostridia bacterium]|nr:bifunctional riboflavin kinase/FAD synthetase [Clostridia bacterium]
MIVVKSNELNNVITKKTAVALGSFDALHKGHLGVIGETVRYAKKNNLLSIVQLVERNDKDKVNALSKRLKILESMGVDVVVIEKFTPEFKAVSYEHFIEEFICKKYNAAAVFAGENYRFGFMAEGDAERLREICGEFNIGVFIVPYVMEGDKIISSSAIRRFVEKGEVEKARDYMSRPFSLSGEVIHSNGVGRKHGFPTANIRIPQELIVPKDGVYATRINVDGKIYQGLTNVGAKPTVKIDERNIETYILNFEGDLYGKKIEIEFLKRIRDTKKFDSLGELKKQIEEDKKRI